MLQARRPAGRCFAGTRGFEPRTRGFGDHRSDQLSYAPICSCLPLRERAASRAGWRLLDSVLTVLYPGTSPAG